MEASDESMPEINIEIFQSMDLRVGVIGQVEINQKARVPAYKLWIDFGQWGVKQSSAQLTARYQPDDLMGRQVVAVVNLPARRVAGFKSEVLVLGVPDDAGQTVLLQPGQAVPAGGRVH